MNTPGAQAFAYIGQVLAGDSPPPIQPAPPLEQPQACTCPPYNLTKVDIGPPRADLALPGREPEKT